VERLLSEIRACRLCRDLPLGPRPLLQAPGRRTHEKGIPFDDPSGDRLRAWLGLRRAQFYDESRVAIVPMGFCFPGSGPSGDLPPRPECAPQWRDRLLAGLPALQLVLVVGRHALEWHLPGEKARTLAPLMQRSGPDGAVVVLPHPSPRNGRWPRQNPWFEAAYLPALRLRIAALLADD
jgi:uracil-DNA glycosylase